MLVSGRTKVRLTTKSTKTTKKSGNYMNFLVRLDLAYNFKLPPRLFAAQPRGGLVHNFKLPPSIIRGAAARRA
jgi:hypothetical protein